MIKLIILDFYGVVIKGSYKDTAKWLGKKYKKNWEDIYKVWYLKYFNQAAEGKINERQFFIYSLHELGFPEHWQTVRVKHISFLLLNRPVFEYAKKLQQRGYKVLLLSKNTPVQFKIILDKYSIRKYFRNIINTHDIHLPKASAKTMRYMMKKYKVTVDEIVMADDQDFNLVEPAKLGVHTILYKKFPQFKCELEKVLK